MEICVERKDWHRTFIAVINKGIKGFLAETASLYI